VHLLFHLLSHAGGVGAGAGGVAGVEEQDGLENLLQNRAEKSSNILRVLNLL